MHPDRGRPLGSSLVLAGGCALALAQWRNAFAGAVAGTGAYGALGEPDANGVRLPAGFSARLRAQRRTSARQLLGVAFPA